MLRASLEVGDDRADGSGVALTVASRERRDRLGGAVEGLGFAAHGVRALERLGVRTGRERRERQRVRRRRRAGGVRELAADVPRGVDRRAGEDRRLHHPDESTVGRRRCELPRAAVMLRRIAEPRQSSLPLTAHEQRVRLALRSDRLLKLYLGILHWWCLPRRCTAYGDPSARHAASSVARVPSGTPRFLRPCLASSGPRHFPHTVT